MKLNNLDIQELITIASSLQECLVMRWEAFRIALEKMDWSYNYIDDFSLWRQSSQNYLMLRKACSSLPDRERARNMFFQAEKRAYG